MKRLKVRLTTFNKNSKRELALALRDISCEDNDFNGENGADYLWQEAQEFESNQDYLVDKVKDKPYVEAIALFLELWLGADSYYEDYEWSLEVNGDIVALAVAYTY